MPGPLGGAPPCPSCEQRVYFNEEKAYMGRSWHKKCFSCENCKKSLESTTANLQEDNGLLCNACQRKLEKPAASAPKEVYVNHDDTECCPRCGKRVYFAEQVLCLNRKWHKLCFNCASCSKKVEVAQAADHDGELYCRSCHGRKFGPKGYGFAGGSGTGLSMDTGRAGDIPTDNIPHTAQAYVAPVNDKENGGTSQNKWGLGGGDVCPRCNKQVYIAERRQAAGHVYHNTCFSCKICNKKLDAGALTEKQDDIFCKMCYSRKFGPKGYGFGNGAGILQMN